MHKSSGLGSGTGDSSINGYQPKDTLDIDNPPKIREFDTGATRDIEEGKNDYEGFLSPAVLQAYGDYMTKHRVQADGELRPSDNWQQGIPKDVYIKSALRHIMDLWLEHRGYPSRDGIEAALGGLLFNIMGYWFESLKEWKETENTNILINMYRKE